MKRRISSWLMWRAERWLWTPKWARNWAFDYAMKHGEPVEIAAWSRPRVVVTATTWDVEVNPAPKTWASGSATNITWRP